MLFEGQNSYITASYAITFIVFLSLFLWVYSDKLKQKKTLETLEKEDD